jgi:hypothetical protein
LETEHKNTWGGTAEDAESAEGNGARRQSGKRSRRWTRMNASAGETAENAEGRGGGKGIRDRMNRMGAEARRTAERAEERGGRDRPQRAQGEETIGIG